MIRSNKKRSIFIGKRVHIGKNVIIEDHVAIGDGSILKNNIVIYPNTMLGKACMVEDGAILGKSPVISRALTRKVVKAPGKLTIGDHTIVGTHAVLFTGTTVGKNCLIGDGANIREGCTIGNNTLIGRGVTINYHTSVGKGCKVLDLTHLTGEMVIEDDVFISTHVVSSNDNIMGRAHHIVHKGPRIKKGALIGGGACLLPAVIIGEYSVVGAGAVVTKDIPPRKLALGVPARVVMDTPERFLPMALKKTRVSLY